MRKAVLDKIELIVAAAAFIQGVRVESGVAAQAEFAENRGGHGNTDIVHLHRVRQEIEAGIDAQLVDQLDFLDALAGGVAQVADLGFQVVADGNAHGRGLALARYAVHLPCIDVIFVRLFLSGGIRIGKGSPAVEMRGLVRAQA